MFTRALVYENPPVIRRCARGAGRGLARARQTPAYARRGTSRETALRRCPRAARPRPRRDTPTPCERVSAVSCDSILLYLCSFFESYRSFFERLRRFGQDNLKGVGD